MPTPTLLMIRPMRQAQEFMRELTKQTGLKPNVIYAPILEITAVTFDPIPKNTQFLLFSSVNGVKFFADQVKTRAIPALCVGDTTTAAAQSAGFTSQSAGGTAQDLIDLTQKTAKPDAGPVIYISGALVANDIDGQLAQLGYETKRRTVYEQSPQPLNETALKSLQSNTIIPVSSPNTAQIFADQTTGIALDNVTFICISENARAPLKHTTSKQITASAPTRGAMIAAICALL